MTKFELYQDNSGEYRWRLRASNGQLIANGGEGYSQKSSARDAIERVQEQAPSAEVEDQT